MIKTLTILILLSCTICAGQSTLIIPNDPTQPSTNLPGEDTASQLSATAPRGDNSDRSVPPEPESFKMPVIGRSQRRVGANSETELDGDASAPTSVRIAGPLSARSDFEKFAEDAAGYTLQVYGRQLFNEVPSTFAPVDRIPVPANYALGPGDELLIRTWGKIELNARVTVDRNGQISLPRVGTLNVLGLRYEQLEGYLRTAIGSIYKDFELNVTLGQLRSIQIFVLGSARRPGAYTVSSLSTLVNALFASGGPSATGTMRNIQLRRGDRLLTEFDIYDLLRKGDKSHDVQLLPGDIIYIPTIGPQVAIVESVNEPGIYELNGETTIASALANAGGLTSLAGVDRVLLERIENHRRRRVDEFTLDASGLQRLLKDGDLLRIFPLSPMFENAVTLRGNVAQPGRYVWHQGMRISNLIPSREFLMTRGHWNQQNQLVAENIDRQFGNSQMAMNSHPDMMTGIAQANAEINWDYAAIERLDEHDLSTRLIAFNLATAIDNPTSLDNQMLEPGDILTIFSRKDLPLPLEKHASFVQVGGEVNTPGVYRIVPGETLRTLVGRAGGLTPHSYLFASQLTRVSTRLIQEEQLRLSISRIQKDLASQYANTPRNAENPSSGQNSANQLAQLNMQRTLVDQLSTTQPNGRVVLGIKPGGMTIADIPDFPLEDGDSLFIPPKLGTVQVTGEVYNANALRYQLRKPLSAYLEDSGGPTRLADVKRIFLIRADGTVVSRQSRQLWQRNFDQMVLMPGDAIIVPPKLKTPGGFMEELPLITQIISQTAMTGAVLSLIH